MQRMLKNGVRKDTKMKLFEVMESSHTVRKHNLGTDTKEIKRNSVGGD